MLVDVLDAVRSGDAGGRERRAEVADAARAWVQTYVDCHEIEAFSVYPAVDPVPLR